MKLKSFTALVATALTMNGCTPGSSQQSAPTTPNAHETEGGVNGGGGGTLPANPSSTYEINEIIEDSKHDLIPYIKGQLRYYDDKIAGSAERKVFGSKPNLYDVLEDTNIEVLQDQPCHDAYGRPTDGSIHASKPGAICISAFTIAPKVVSERAKVEVLALIVHELSHLLGTTEEEARTLQKGVSLEYTTYPGHPQDDGDAFVKSLIAPGDLLAQTAAQISLDGKPKDVLTALGKLSEADSAFFTGTYQAPFTILDRHETNYYMLIDARFTLLNYFFENDADANQELDGLFQGKTQVTYSDYLKWQKLPSELGREFGDQILERIETLDQAKKSYAEIRRFYETAAQIARDINFDTRPTPIILPGMEKSPFEPFAGHYSVISKNCDAKMRLDDATEFDIDFDARDVAYHLIVRGGSSYSMEDGQLHNAANMSWGSSYTQVSGDKDWAERTAEYGDRWNNRQGHGFRKESVRIEKTVSGFQFRRTEYYEQPTQTSFDETTHSCVFQLARLQP